MATTPPLDFEHKLGFEIETKHKEAIRQLHWFAKVPICQLETRYKLGNSTIRRILAYDTPSRDRPGRVGPAQKLTDAKMDEVIEYCAKNWEQRIMKYDDLIRELDLSCTASTLRKTTMPKGLLLLHRLPEALPQYGTSYWTIPLGNCPECTDLLWWAR
jgi:hypothetical protein